MFLILSIPSMFNRLTIPSCILVMLFLLRVPVAAQQNTLDKWSETRTLLQLNAAYITVSRHAVVLLDSSLILAANGRKLSRVPVITEGIDDDYCRNNCSWIDRGKADSVINRLTGKENREEARSLLLLGAYYAFQPGAADYEKAITFLQKAKAMAMHQGWYNWVSESYCLLGKASFMLVKVEEGKRWMDSAFHTADKKIRAKALNYAGTFCPFMPETHAYRIKCLQDALLLYQQTGDKGNQCNVLTNLGYMNFAAKDIALSLQATKQSLQLQRAICFPYTYYTSDLLVYLFMMKGEYPEMISQLSTTIIETEKMHDTSMLVHLYYRAGWAHVQLDQYDLAKHWIDKGLGVMGGCSNQEVYSLLELISLIGDVDLGKNSFELIQQFIRRMPPENVIEQQAVNVIYGDYYIALKDFKRAGSYFTAAERLAPAVEKIRGGMKDVHIISSLADCSYHSGNYSKSKVFFSLILSPGYIHYASEDDIRHVHYRLYQIDSFLGNASQALNHLSMAYDLREKLYNAAEMKLLAEYSTKYQALQREKDVQRLSASYQMQQQQAKAARRLYYCIVLFLAVIILLLYVRYRNNQRKNAQLRCQKDEIDRQNLALQALNNGQKELLEEKEWLVKEIHHRTKNNLHIITSLLTSQSVYLKDKVALKAMLDSKHRVQAMALIHQKLYLSENMHSIYMPEYIGELVDYLKDSFSVEGNVVFNIEVAPVRLDVSKAIPVGLILNEVITNAFKYAFPHTAEDKITVKLTEDGQLVLLSIADNGKGVPEGFDFASCRSFGMTLIRGMVEDLEGVFDIHNSNGLTIQISFTDYVIPVKKYETS